MIAQIALVYVVVIADAYSDGIMIRYLVNALIACLHFTLDKVGIKSQIKINAFPFWTVWQWLWHLAKWLSFFTFPMYNIFCVWKWDFWLLTAPVSIGALALWQLTYRWDFIYRKELP